MFAITGTFLPISSILSIVSLIPDLLAIAIKCIIDEFKDDPVTFKKGDWFMTGSVIQPFKVNKGDKLKVDFRSLGKINLDFI